MDYAEAIKQDVQSLLLTDKVEVTVTTSEQDSSISKGTIRFGILVGKGKKGGLLLSADVHTDELKTALDNCLLMIRSQLALYGIACLQKGYIAKLDDIFMPSRTHTVVFGSNSEADTHAKALIGIVGAFNMFEGTYFNGDKIPKTVKTKSIKKVTKKKANE